MNVISLRFLTIMGRHHPVECYVFSCSSSDTILTALLVQGSAKVSSDLVHIIKLSISFNNYLILIQVIRVKSLTLAIIASSS